MTLFPTIAIFLSVCLLALPYPGVSLAATIPADSIERQVGILKLTNPSGDEQAFHLLETRLKRWLEDSSDLTVRAKLLGSFSLENSLDLSSYRQKIGFARLSELSNALISSLESGASLHRSSSGELFQKLQEQGQSLAGMLERGPLLQKALVAEAFYLCRYNRWDECVARLRQAALLHPDASIRPALSWDLESSTQSGALFEAMRRAGASIHRSCSVNLEVSPAQSELTLNGFALAPSAKLSLVPGLRYLLAASASGYLGASTELECRKSGVQRRALRLIRGGSGASGKWDKDLSQVAVGNGVQSLLLIESRQDRFHLYLFTPGVSIDEIPLRKPLAIHEVFDKGPEGSLPISRELFDALFEKHRMAPLKLALTLPENRITDGSGYDWRGITHEKSGVPRTRWYNSTAFWAITGTLVVGAAAAYFATQSHPVKSQGGLAVKLD